MSVNGVLEFTLGLNTHEFLHGAGLSTGAIEAIGVAGEAMQKTLEVAFEGVKSAAEKTWQQIEKGAALFDLAGRTGENVANLFMLQKGFKATGVSADGVGSALFMLNKSLGGVNEMGENTNTVFEKMGLSITELKANGGASAFVSVMEKLSQLNPTSATKAASMIFGRGVAGDIVQMSRNFKEFQESMAGARAQAEVFQKVAEVFKAIEHGVTAVKAKLDPIFLTIAAKLSPFIKQSIDWVRSFDVSPIARVAGNVIDVFANAFKQGRMTELLKDGFQAAVEYIGNIIMGSIGSGKFWEGVWGAMESSFMAFSMAMTKAFLTYFTLMGATMIHVLDIVIAKLADSPIGKLFGFGGWEADSFDDTFSDARGDFKGMQDQASVSMGEYMKNAAKGFKKAAESVMGAAQGGEASGQFGDLIQHLLGGASAGEAQAGENKGPGKDLDLSTVSGGQDKQGGGGGGNRTNASELERMGFVFRGGASVDHMETTARNTTTMVTLLQSIDAGLKQGDRTEFVNA